MSYLPKFILLAVLVYASALVFHNPALADPPAWAPAHGYRSKHASDHKPRHHKHHHKRHHHKDDDDSGYKDDYKHYRSHHHNGYDDDEDAYRYDERYEFRPSYNHDERLARRDRAPLFVNGKCTPRLTGLETGAALGRELGSQMTTGSPFGTVAGTLIGAMLGSQLNGSIAAADQDCISQVLEGAPDKQEIFWDNTAASTRYELTPTRTYRQGGRTCREFVTTVVRNGRPREVYNTACRDSDGRWWVAQ